MQKMRHHSTEPLDNWTTIPLSGVVIPSLCVLLSGVVSGQLSGSVAQATLVVNIDCLGGLWLNDAQNGQNTADEDGDAGAERFLKTQLNVLLACKANEARFMQKPKTKTKKIKQKNI